MNKELKNLIKNPILVLYSIIVSLVILGYNSLLVGNFWILFIYFFSVITPMYSVYFFHKYLESSNYSSPYFWILAGQFLLQFAYSSINYDPIGGNTYQDLRSFVFEIGIIGGMFNILILILGFVVFYTRENLE